MGTIRSETERYKVQERVYLPNGYWAADVNVGVGLINIDT